MTGSLLGLLDEDRQQADHDGEHAESFGEAGEDDREAADLPGCVGVTPDGASRETTEDADADARADDPDGGKSGAEMFHWCGSSYVRFVARRTGLGPG